MNVCRKRPLAVLAFSVACLGTAPSLRAQTFDTAALNRTPAVHSAFQAFYNMDYVGALEQFQRVQAEHPDDPLATDYVLDVTLFEELNRLDLLDTTFYANDGFLTGKHKVAEDTAVRDRIASLSGKAEDQADALLAKDPKDADALYARGWARSLQATYDAVGERSFIPALKLALQARNDERDVLAIDPNYIDADLIVGVYQYVVGALPFSFRMLVGVVGISGSKTKGMEMLQNVAVHGVLSSVEARTCMMLFLRREAKYAEAQGVAASLANQYPHDYLFQLERANLEKDAGDAPQAIAQYRRAIAEVGQPGYFHNAHMELAYFGLADTLRGQKDYEHAAQAYQQAASMPTASPELKQRCLVAAGKSYDLMRDHTRATHCYQQAVDAGSGTELGNEASTLIRKPYEGK